MPRNSQTPGRELIRNWFGKLDRSQLGISEKVVTKVVRAPEGDFRRWKEIRDWARDISLQLQEKAATR